MNEQMPEIDNPLIRTLIAQREAQVEQTEHYYGSVCRVSRVVAILSVGLGLVFFLLLAIAG